MSASGTSATKGLMDIVAVVGLGYVGLPLAIAFDRTRRTIGFDIDERKIARYRQHCDATGEVAPEDFAAARSLEVTTEAARLKEADVLIVTLPTPIDRAHQPDFGPLVAGSRIVGENMKPGAIVVFESTVYPGATEEVCVPVLERHSGMRWKRDFHVAYSPERINPGDLEHTLARIVKVVAGDDEETLERIADLYASIVPAGIHRASSIKVAEAAKAIENTQRDLNIALMNELAIIFNRLGIDTLEVLAAAETKWNFLPFRPGLVGGHCIGVDPYYLTYKADMLGYHPQVILAGRRINDGMGTFIAAQTIKQLVRCGRRVNGAKVNLLGLTFKENCPDLRNSRVIDVISELKSFGVEVFVHDPVPDAAEARTEYGVDLLDWQALPAADAILVAVAHREFLSRPAQAYARKAAQGAAFIDVKSRFDREALKAAGFAVWRL